MDLTVTAIPFFFGSMGAEAWWLERTAAAGRERSGGDYERRDTVASLTMGVASLFAPIVTKQVFHRFDLAEGRYRRAVLGVAGGAALATVVADAVARAGDQEPGALPGASDPSDTERVDADRDEGAAADAPRPLRRRAARLARKVAGAGAVTAVAAAGAAVCGTWAARTTGRRLFDKRVLPDWGGGPLALTAAILGWDFIYYWNHRFMHESRYMWAIHVVHHSSEHYNLSTALRQPVADSLGTFVPYGTLAFLGIRPDLIETARALNLLYQFWIHTETIPKLGWFEKVLNTPSHHRAHHGSNRQYLDRNHGSILIVWDRLFGTFEEEDEPVVYGLTKNIDTFNPLRIATHEYVDMARDVAASDTWPDRVGFVMRSPGWAYRRHEEAGTVAAHAAEEAVPTPHLADATAGR